MGRELQYDKYNIANYLEAPSFHSICVLLQNPLFFRKTTKDMLKADIIVSETDKATIFVVVPSERLFPECAEFSSLSFSVRFLKWVPVLFAVKSPAGMLEGEWVVVLILFPGMTFTPPS